MQPTKTYFDLPNNPHFPLVHPWASIFPVPFIPIDCLSYIKHRAIANFSSAFLNSFFFQVRPCKSNLLPWSLQPPSTLQFINLLTPH